MATPSSVLAWRIPGAGEPGGLPSMELHRVRHDWSDLAAAAAEESQPSSLSVGEYLNKQFCILYVEMLPSNKKAGNIDTLYNLDDSRELYANWEEANLKRSHMIWIYLCNVLEVTNYKNEKINGFQELEEGHRGQTGEGVW